MKGRKIGRPLGTTQNLTYSFVRISFVSEAEQNELMDYVKRISNGMPLGFTIRTIIKDHKEKKL